MTPADLDKRAELTVWPNRSLGRSAEGRPYATLREALAAAAEAIAVGDAQPWIITEEGDVLSPGWIRANTRSSALQ
ncbi:MULTISPECIES: hypothetical protein [Methylobacterium]|jgi:hypothetical protein|uniref:hypothetical protein n=1 Tax=Methylobacterium TaxID=407 RepID=UPI0011C77982|nr:MULTISPECIES: hypothetical protein [Methylobacterium]TXN45873.1 hypothetical protein FV233_10055 [Methylobacterium sp. WL7]TXN57886.1 hypothetical protein FV228_25390 [Methylobacterium sp. WL18]GJE23473.1 hypothetical protein JHFBIEKO_3936 [Methylobacterium mesophilicum]